MSIITLTLTISDPVEVFGIYDVIKVYRSTLGETGDFVEVSGVATRVPIVGSLTSYEYEDDAGDPSY